MAKKSYTRKTAEQKKEEVEKLLNELNQGVLNFQYEPEVYQSMLLLQASLPKYSFRNLLLIKAQCEESTFVASFKTWKEKGRNVIKGERALRILAPRFKDVEHKETGVVKDKLIGFVTVPVFDISQTEGEPFAFEKKLALDGESDEADCIYDWTLSLADEDDCSVIDSLKLDRGNGLYNPAKHEIMVSSHLSGNHKAKTAVHELVHSRVHRHCNRNITTIEERESVAEGVAFIICSYFGLDTSDYSFEYVRGWSSDKGQSLLKYGEVIQKTANQLILDYERVSAVNVIQDVDRLETPSKLEETLSQAL